MNFSRHLFFTFKNINNIEYYECPMCFCEILKEEIDTSILEFNKVFSFSCPECDKEIDIVYTEINGEEGIRFSGE